MQTRAATKKKKIGNTLATPLTIAESFSKYHNMESVEEILMNLDLDSSINIQLLMLEYIGSKRGRKIIKQIYELDNDFLERNFPIGNLPEHNDFIDMEI